MTEKPNIAFRQFQRDTDYELMRSILMESTKADQINETAAADDIRNWCAPRSV